MVGPIQNACEPGPTVVFGFCDNSYALYAARVGCNETRKLMNFMVSYL